MIDGNSAAESRNAAQQRSNDVVWDTFHDQVVAYLVDEVMDGRSINAGPRGAKLHRIDFVDDLNIADDDLASLIFSEGEARKVLVARLQGRLAGVITNYLENSVYAQDLVSDMCHEYNDERYGE
jgi:hypothetical protein